MHCCLHCAEEAPGAGLRRLERPDRLYCQPYRLPALLHRAGMHTRAQHPQRYLALLHIAWKYIALHRLRDAVPQAVHVHRTAARHQRYARCAGQGIHSPQDRALHHGQVRGIGDQVHYKHDWTAWLHCGSSTWPPAQVSILGFFPG